MFFDFDGVAIVPQFLNGSVLNVAFILVVPKYIYVYMWGATLTSTF